MAAQGVDAATGPADVAEQELEDRGGPDDLRPESVLRPSDRIDDRRNFFQIAVFSNRGEKIGSFNELGLRDPGNSLDNLRRVS